MANVLENSTQEVERLRALVQSLLNEHREFSAQTSSLNQGISEGETSSQLMEIFSPLREELMNHMLTEESEIFPEVSRRGYFTERISEIMQQHLDITALLDAMKFAISRGNWNDLREAFHELSVAMNLHFVLEEKEVFSLLE